MKAQVWGRTVDAPQPRFGSYLREELAGRCGRNPRYSLRAFARHLGLDHSTLSQFMRGKRSLAPRSIERLGARLGLSSEAVMRFVAAEAEPADSWMTTEVRQLAQDAARLLGEWHHYAILELIRLRTFKADVRWISRVLGITDDEVNVALQRLLRLGLLKMSDRNRWTDNAGHAVATLDDFSERTISGLSDAVRALAASALARPSLAHHSATTLAVSAGRSRLAIDRIERFRRDLIGFLETDASDRDEVYRLEIALFPLTHVERKE